MSTKEIERKFLVTEIPNDLQIENTKEVYQTYLAIGEEEIRVRKIIHKDKSKYSMTVKRGLGLSRDEIEFDITEETYNQLLDGSNKIPIIKLRHKVIINNQKFDLDIFRNYLDPNLKTIEIEFPNEDEAATFIKPNWFGEDLTEDKSFKNQSLWKKIQKNKTQ